MKQASRAGDASSQKKPYGTPMSWTTRSIEAPVTTANGTHKVSTRLVVRDGAVARAAVVFNVVGPLG